MLYSHLFKVRNYTMLVKVQTMKKLDVRSEGVSSRIPDTTLHTIVMDYDNITDARLTEELIHIDLFSRENVIETISRTDFEKIKSSYLTDLGIKNNYDSQPFFDGVKFLEKRYGVDYAKPNPDFFEAMNLNLSWVLSEKFRATPIDDVLRVPLYEYKALQTVKEISGIKHARYATEVMNQARQWIILPSTPITDVDYFLELHKDPLIHNFRKKVKEFAQSGASPQVINQQIYEANKELEELKIDDYTLFGGLLSLTKGLIDLVNGSATGVISTTTGLLALTKELRKAEKEKNYAWLQFLKGFNEQ